VEVKARRRPANVVLGGIVLAWPGPTILVASNYSGVYLLLTGFTTVSGVTLPGPPPLAFCCLSAARCRWVLAVLSFRHFGMPTILLLSIWIGIGFIFQAFRRSRLDRRAELARAGLGTSSCVISVIAGFVVLVWPFNSIVMLRSLPACGLSSWAWSIVQAFKSEGPQRPCENMDSVSERFTPESGPRSPGLPAKESRRSSSAISSAQTGLPGPAIQTYGRMTMTGRSPTRG